jgi:hypothetical protein
VSALLILACSATKRHDAGLLPAIDRYDGPAYRVLRKALRERPGLAERLTIRILSAEYGLIRSDQPILDYDRKMSKIRARELRFGLGVAVQVTLIGCQWRSLHINVGATYWDAMPHDGYPEGAPLVLGHGGIGERLGQLKAWLGRQ